MLFRLPDGNSAESVRTGLAEVIQRLPDHLWQSLTWDQGQETTDMAALTQAERDKADYSLNSRPRQTLGWTTPSQKLAEALR